MIRIALTAIAAWTIGTRDAEACTIVATSSVAFGTYDVYAAAPLDSTGSVTYRCALSIAITITISTGSSGTYAARRMSSGANALVYNLYTNAARTTIWGDGTGGTGQYGPVIGLLSNTTIPLYARIPAGQNAAAGSYSDAVVVTLNY